MRPMMARFGVLQGLLLRVGEVRNTLIEIDGMGVLCLHARLAEAREFGKEGPLETL